MATQQDKINKAFLQGKMEKYGVTRKSLYSILSVLACIAMIVVFSITQAYFNPEKLKTIEYWITLMIQIAICIFGMIAGKQAGDDMSRNLPDGRYRVSLNGYSQIIATIKTLGLYAYIGDWLEFYRQRKLEDKIKMILGDNGIRQMEVLDLNFSELENLKTAGWQKNWENTPYRAKYWKASEEKSYTNFVEYTERQIAVIRAVKEGKVKVSKLPSTFFVNAFSESEKDEWESSANAAKKKGLYLGFSYSYKVIGMALFSIMITGLEVASQGGGGDGTEQARVWMTIISRIGGLLMSYVWGMFIGFNMVKIDNEYLDFKVSTMTDMIEEYKKGIYKIKTVEEMAEQAHKIRETKTMGLSFVEGEETKEV